MITIGTRLHIPRLTSTEYGEYFAPNGSKLPKFHWIDNEREPSAKFLADNKADFIFSAKPTKYGFCIEQPDWNTVDININADRDTEESDWIRWASGVALYLGNRQTQFSNKPLIKMRFRSFGSTAARARSVYSFSSANVLQYFDIIISKFSVDLVFVQPHKQLVAEWRGAEYPLAEVVAEIHFTSTDHVEYTVNVYKPASRYENEVRSRILPRRWLNFYSPIPESIFTLIKKDSADLALFKQCNLVMFVAYMEYIVENRDVFGDQSYSGGIFIYNVDVREVFDLLYRYKFWNYLICNVPEVRGVRHALPEELFRCDTHRYDNLAKDACLRWPINKAFLVELSMALHSLIHSAFAVMLILEHLENFQFTNWSEHIRLTTIQGVFDSIRRVKAKEDKPRRLWRAK